MGRRFPQPQEGNSPPEFGLDATHMGRLTLDLGSAMDNRIFEIGGNVLWAIETTALAVKADITFNSERNDSIPYQRGIGISGAAFSRIFVTAEAQPGQTMTLIYFRADPELVQALRLLNSAISGQTVEVTKSSNLQTSVDVSLAATSVTTIRAADSTRREIVLRALGANIETLRIGDANVGSSRGIELEPGESIVISTTDQVKAYNPGAAAQFISVMEVMD